MALSLTLLQTPTPFPPPSPKPSNDTLSCSSMAELKQHHSHLIRLGLAADNHAVGRLIKFCALSDTGDFAYALRLFHSLPQPDAFVYNTLMRAQPLSPGDSLALFSLMLSRSVAPNRFTFPPVFRACSRLDNGVEPGRQVHAHAVKSGLGDDGFSRNALIHMYASLNSVEEARKVFDTMPKRDVVSWTTLVAGLAQCGLVDEALELFQAMPERNSVSWNAMIAALARSGRSGEAFALFRRMREENAALLDKFLAASMLAACAGVGALEQGRWIHAYVEASGVELDSKLGTTIVDMYCKCGSLEEASRVFETLPSKGISSWNSMIGGLAMHGKGEAAVKLFERMQREKVGPDGITFVNLLSACAHSGLVEEGRRFFQSMTEKHGIEPGAEHFGCMVDLLGRAGKLEAARETIDKMPMSPDAGVLGALLGACRIHGDVELGGEIGERVIELEPNNSGRYVLLANLYAKAERWEDVARVRRLMNDRGVKKLPGYSTIELEGVVNEFIAGGRTHPESRDIYAKIDEVLERIRSLGYVPDVEGVLHDLNEEAKESALFHHSEKLAIAFGLLKTKAGETIRISKNLRVCKDCHNASKLISAAFNREIIVRDRNRFHHFRMGECSCKDYW